MTGLKPLTIGNLTIENPVALGPMAGVTDRPFRALCREQGCGVFYTEMVSAKALHYRNRNTEALLKTGEDEHPVGVQLFGSEPEIISEAALMLEDRFDFIDFNMGCPVPKIVKNREGSWLLNEPGLVREIFRRLVKTVRKPVSVKMRIGFSEGERQGLTIAQILEDCGVSLIAVHGRTRAQYYSGKADWDAIRKIREAVRIPVIGNGDIFTAYDAKRMVEETGVSGVMVARGAEGNPWIFREINGLFYDGKIPERPTEAEIRAMILRHAALLLEEKGEKVGMLEMRRHAAQYLSGLKCAAKMRRALNEVHTFQELKCLLTEEF